MHIIDAEFKNIPILCVYQLNHDVKETLEHYKLFLHLNKTKKRERLLYFMHHLAKHKNRRIAQSMEFSINFAIVFRIFKNTIEHSYVRVSKR